MRGSSSIPARLQASTIAGIRAKGVNYAAGRGLDRDAQAVALTHALRSSVVNGRGPRCCSRPASSTIGALLSLLIPVYGPPAPDAVPAAGVEPGEVAVAVEML